MRWFGFALLSLILVTSLQGTIIHVPGDKATIQGGINVAFDGDTVLVSAGTYRGDGNRRIDFGGRAIVVMSGSGPEVTIIDCEGSGRGFTFQNRESSTSVLQGFTITNGFSNYGGGVYNDNSDPTISNCTFTGNHSDRGGGGMNNYLSSPTVANCAFSGNYSSNGSGGGMYNQRYSSPTVTNCTFIGNSAYDGGGMGNDDYSSPMIINCTFSQNEIIGGSGAGMFNEGSDPIVTNCTFSENSGRSNRGAPAGLSVGGGMCNVASDPTVTNCTFTGNYASYGGGMYNSISDPVITNCIFWGNILHEIQDNGYSDAIVSYSDVMRGYPGAGNIDSDPLFIAPEISDYHLQMSSPCVDAGDPLILDACLPPGLGGDRSDMGAYGGAENCGWTPYNYPPTITSSPDTLAVIGFEYNYDVEAADPNGDTLSFFSSSYSFLAIDRFHIGTNQRYPTCRCGC